MGERPPLLFTTSLLVLLCRVRETLLFTTSLLVCRRRGWGRGDGQTPREKARLRQEEQDVARPDGCEPARRCRPCRCAAVAAQLFGRHRRRVAAPPCLLLLTGVAVVAAGEASGVGGVGAAARRGRLLWPRVAEPLSLAAALPLFPGRADEHPGAMARLPRAVHRVVRRRRGLCPSPRALGPARRRGRRAVRDVRGRETHMPRR